MDMELTTIQMVQDFEELAEQYDSAAVNESIWASGAHTREQIDMHLQNAKHNREMAKMYRKMAEHTLSFAETYMEEE